MITTVIFDLDGLLTDTERLHCQAYQQTLAEVGVSMTEEEYADHWIRQGLSIADFVRLRGISQNPMELRERKSQIYERLVETSLRPMPGAIRLLQTLHGLKRLALASSARSDSVACVLRELDIARFFDLIATDGSVARLKPHPDIFLYVAAQLRMQPSECVVLEDAEKGILAAHAAGMKSIAVPTRQTQDNDFSQATRIVKSLEEVTLELLEEL